jgi:hypothetical protein
MDHQVSQEQAMDVLLNGFLNHEATPSILGLQVPNFVSANSNLSSNSQAPGLQSRYNVLLGIIEELKKDIRPTYALSKTSAERVKRNINLARSEIRNCILEMERCNDGNQH